MSVAGTTMADRTFINNREELEKVGFRVDSFQNIKTYTELWEKVNAVAKANQIGMPAVVATKKLSGSGCPICQIPHRFAQDLNWEDAKKRLSSPSNSTDLYVVDAYKYILREVFTFMDAPSNDLPTDIKPFAYYNPYYDERKVREIIEEMNQAQS